MDCIKWDKTWNLHEESDVLSISPSGVNDEFTYWWDDMRPREVCELVERAYEAGYNRAYEEIARQTLTLLSNDVSENRMIPTDDSTVEAFIEREVKHGD